MNKYGYDKHGKITSEKTTSRYAAGGSSYTKTFEYDTSGRLTRSTVIDENVYDPQSGDEGITITQYSYDAAGNLEEETSGGIEKTYSHNGFNQLTSAIERDGEDVLSDISYLYDANGNRIEENNNTSGETVLMQYNAFDMMSRYEKKEGTDTVFLQENRYDGSGKRIEKKEIRERENEAQPGDTSLEKVTKRYTYQGDTVLQTDVSHIDVSGFSGTPQTGAMSDDTECFNLLTPGGNIVSTSRKHEDNSGEAENWYTFNKDYNGSTTSIISHTGAAVSTYEYDDYGTISAVTDDIDNEVCYTGQIYDEGTGLYYYNARYYDSEDACFTSMDTYRGDNMIPLTLNLYMYCGGDPINYTDPTGHGFLKKLFKKLVKAATKSSSRKASRKTTKKSTHRASATIRRKAVVKRASSAAKKVKKKVKKAAKKTVKTAKKVAKTLAVSSATAVIKGTAKVIPGSNHLGNDLALQISSIASVIDAGHKGKQRTYSRTIEGSGAALIGASLEIGYAVTSQKQVALTASVSFNGIYGFGASVIKKDKYYNTGTLNKLREFGPGIGVNVTNGGVSMEAEHNEIIDSINNSNPGQEIGFGYGIGVGAKYWKARVGGNAGFSFTMVQRIW